MADTPLSSTITGKLFIACVALLCFLFIVSSALYILLCVLLLLSDIAKAFTRDEE